jgi:hypothetical protein
MLEGKLERYEETKRGVTIILENGDAAKFADDLERFFASEGYRLEDGTPQNGTYARGGGGAFAIVGAFSSRMKFKVQIVQESGKTRLMINRGMSGMWGGFIGKSKVTNELSRVTLKIKSMLGS